jgi:hypothetical protein
MGAVLGLAAWGRTQEKLGGANNGGMQPVAQSVTTTFGSPQSQGFGNNSGFGSPAPSGFGSSPGYGASTSGPYNPAPSWGTTQTTASGKKIVPQDDQPAI